MTTTHTPGPWQFDGQVILDEDGSHVASPIGCDTVDCDDEAIANARLIAAAPDLLAACEAFLGEIDEIDACGQRHGIGAEIIAAVEAAIAKARGK